MVNTQGNALERHAQGFSDAVVVTKAQGVINGSDLPIGTWETC